MIILIYIYYIYFPTSNKYYVGQTYNLKKRMFEHLRSKSLVGNALNKYNDWQVTILHICKTRDQANLLEIEEIRNFNCVAPNGYNLTAGGEGNDSPRSEETKEKMSEAHQGNQNAEGHKHTEETKEKMSKAHLRENLSEETIEKMSEALIGNQNAKGKNIDCSNKNGSDRPEVKERISKAMQGNQYSKGVNIDGSNKNGSDRIDVKIKRLQTRIIKLEQELENRQ